jgi:diguanylate cyclase (GGDEF)-like protein
VAKDHKRQNAFIIVLGGRTEVGRMFHLQEEVTIGRTEGLEIRLEDDGVSRKHAKVVRRSDGEAELVDLGSTNGTFVNGERIVGSRLLQDGDKIQIGSTAILKFSYQDALDEAMQKNLYESATRDALTRLYNKKFLTDTMQKEFAYAIRHNVPLALIMLDVDHFKKVNDVHGHPAGDFVLQLMAATLVSAVRLEDIVGRYGGEEFTIILRETNETNALLCAERVRVAVEGTDFTYEGKKINVTCSLGVSCLENRNYPHVNALLGAADGFLYRAKKGGRNRVISYTKPE